MKKESIQKVFRRYIGIYDNILFEKTGNHLPDETINEIQSKVDSLFKEYETMDELYQYINFSKRIIEIIEDILKKANNEQNAFLLKELKKQYEIEDPIIWLDNELKELREKTIQAAKEITSSNHIYVPHDPYFEAFSKKYRIVLKSENLDKLIQNKEDFKTAKKWNSEVKDIVDTYAINDVPLQFTADTLHKYFYNQKLLEIILLSRTASSKNIFVLAVKNLENELHTDEYELDLQKLYLDVVNSNTVQGKYMVWRPEIVFDEKQLHINSDILFKELIYRKDVLAKFNELYNTYKKDKGISYSIKSKYKLVIENFNKLKDVSVIRINKFLENLSTNYKDLNDKQHRYTLLNILVTIPLNELETIELNKDQNQYIANNLNYINIINQYDLKVQYSKYNNLFNILLFEELVNKFNKTYKFEYIKLFGKSKIEQFKNKFKQNKN